MLELPLYEKQFVYEATEMRIAADNEAANPKGKGKGKGKGRKGKKGG